MTLVENIQTWKEAVESYNEGDFQTSLDKFKNMKNSSARIAFNIGRTYLSLCDLQAAIKAFQDVIKRDEHLAVGHFMLGVVNLMCTRHSEALVNFTETIKILREKKFIDYRQLGLRYKLYKCEVLLNRAVCLSSLGYIDRAVEDLLSALQCKVEPRHSIIDVSLHNLQNGQGVEFLVMDAIFHPPKSKTANLEKRDYLGKSQVVVDTTTYETMEPPLHLQGRLNSSSISTPQALSSENGECYLVLYDFIAQSVNEVSVKAGDLITVVEMADDGWFTMVTNDARKTGLVPGSYVEKYNEKEKPITSREALLKDLRKKETRQSLRKVQPAVNNPRFSGRKHNSSIDNDHTYANGFHQSARKERPKTTDLGGLGTTNQSKVETKLHRGPPKFRRKNSLDNLLAEKNPAKISPSFGRKKVTELKQREENNNISSDDDDGYEKMPVKMPEVKPYAIHDVIAPDERRKGPERPAPPRKVVTTMKSPPPRVIPRVPRANTVSSIGSVEGEKRTPGSPTPIPKPSRIPPKVPQTPKVPQSPRRNKNNSESKESRSQNVELTFTVTTSFNINSSTKPEDIQNAAKEAITRNIASSLWCEKDDNRIRLDDYRVSNISDLVKDGKLKIWCSP